MYQVATLLYPRALATSVTLPTEILAAAAQMAQVKSRHYPGVKPLLAGAGNGPVKLFGGITLSPDISRDQLPDRRLWRGRRRGPDEHQRCHERR